MKWLEPNLEDCTAWDCIASGVDSCSQCLRYKERWKRINASKLEAIESYKENERKRRLEDI